MTVTPNLGLPYIDAGQAQKHVTHNEALRALDTLVQLAVLDRDLAVPPASPAEGARWIVKNGASGAWAGHAGDVAAWQDGAWQFSAPVAGWVAYVVDEEILVAWDGGSWNAVGAGGGGDLSELQNVALLGIGTAADATNPLSARLNNVLWAAKTVAAGGDGTLRYVMSKESAAKNLSLIMQDNFVGCAEIGLTGDDDFHFKVSPDGTSWLEAIKIDRASGRISFPVSGGPREVLSANRSYYVDAANGNDGNDGLAAGTGRAFQTIQKAWNTIIGLDLAGYTVTIQLADGTYTGGLSAAVPALGGNVIVNGNASTPTNVIVNKSSGDTVSLLGGARLTLQNLRVASGGNGCIADGAGTKLTLGVGFSLGACTNVGLMAQTNGEVRVGNGLTVAGNMTAYYWVQNGGIITSSSAITMSGTPVFSTAGIVFDTGGAVTLYGSTSFSGSATGKRYQGTLNAILQSFGAGTSTTFFPGNSNGTTASGAQQA